MSNNNVNRRSSLSAPKLYRLIIISLSLHTNQALVSSTHTKHNLLKSSSSKRHAGATRQSGLSPQNSAKAYASTAVISTNGLPLFPGFTRKHPPRDFVCTTLCHPYSCFVALLDDIKALPLFLSPTQKRLLHLD